ncbi:MAG: hypothetical protein ACFB15_00470 [Cyclobacteriaceae bacterium]
MGYIRKLILVLITLLAVSCGNHSKEGGSQKSSIAKYVNFIDEYDKPSAKEYVINLFEKYDFVMLCERDHRDISQYDLFIEIISDPYFKENVGHVFLEIGVNNFQGRINDFILSEGLSEEEKYQQLRDIQRNIYYFPLWEKYNYSYFLAAIYDVNQNLRMDQKIRVYPSGLSMDWTTTKNFDDIKRNYRFRPLKDSLMAFNIINDIDSLEKKENGEEIKALMILNFHHAFNDSFSLEPSCGNFLFKTYPGRVANVLINNVKTLEEANVGIDIPLQNGKWDAAFDIAGNPNIGFNFENSPFGKDSFDFYPYEPHNYTYSDIFTGFIFYKPISEFQLAIGFPGLLEGGFKREYERRSHLFSMWRSDDSTLQIREMSDALNSLKYYPPDDLDTIQYLIDDWKGNYLSIENE